EPYLERLGRRGVGDHEAVVSWIDLRDRLADQHQDGWLEWRLDLLENLEGVGIENASKGGALRHAGAQLADLHVRVHESAVVGPQGDELGDKGPLGRKLRFPIAHAKLLEHVVHPAHALRDEVVVVRLPASELADNRWDALAAGKVRGGPRRRRTPVHDF